MPGLDRDPRRSRREGSLPDGERRLASGAAGEIEPASDDLHWAGNGFAGREIRLVGREVERRSSAVILAEGVDAAGLVAAGPVGGERAPVEGPEVAGPRPFRQQPVEIRQWIAA